MTTPSPFADVAGRSSVAIRRPPRPPTGVVAVPGSKSLTNRALLLAALADGRSRLAGALDAEDTRLMVAALRRCGVGVATSADATVLDVDGVGGPLTTVDRPDDAIEVGTSGTVSRFLGAVIAASPVTATLDGSVRMRERPMAQLFAALVDQGATITSTGVEGFLPARVVGARPVGGTIVLDGPASSQIVSALVLSSLVATTATRIVLTAGTPARPYVDMTLAAATAFGATARWVDADVIEVEPGALSPRTWAIEPDASAATYAWALAALHGGDVTVAGLDTSSLQGDVAFTSVLARMGANVEHTTTGIRVAGTGRLRGVDVDLTAMPDPGVTLAALAVHAEGPTRIRGVRVHRHHETDRIAAAATELRRLGAEVTEFDDGLAIMPPDHPIAGVAIDTYRDHRMAMAFALLGEVVVNDPGCVAKTWPGYFAFLDDFGMVVDDPE